MITEQKVDRLASHGNVHSKQKF